MTHGGVILLKAGSLASITLRGGSKLTIATFKSALFKDVYTTKQLCVNLDTTYLHAIHRIIASLTEDESLMLVKMKTVINLFEMNAASHSQGLYNDIIKMMNHHANDSRFVMDELVAYLNQPYSRVAQVLTDRNTSFAKLLSKIRIDMLTNKLLAEPCEGKHLITMVNECGFHLTTQLLTSFKLIRG
ncbi:hypothetical protein [Photobacterium damselae]|uniref:hypothetical protein n=1 Tax=Photobacterium damselae TaxID=38293 RepID=UPI001F2BA47F|nr:hypothetical protein [Photobacterium damselae]UKA04004.1 hypothetical protein IHC89_15865 [Photobacterium damselae subsp. damselae]